MNSKIILYKILIGIILISGCVQNVSNINNTAGITTAEEEVKSAVSSNDLGLPTKEDAEYFGFSFVKEINVTTVKLLEQKFGTDKAEIERIEKVAGYPTPISGLSREFNVQKSDGTIIRAIDSTIKIFETEDRAKAYYTFHMNKVSQNPNNIIAEPKFGEDSIIEKKAYPSLNVTNYLLLFRHEKTIVELILYERSINVDMNSLIKFGRLIEGKTTKEVN